MRDDINMTGLPGIIRTLDRQEMPLLREHLLRLDPESRRDRFNGFADVSFIAKYAEKCQADGTIIMAYLENGKVLAAAELHPADGPDSPLPEVAFSVEHPLRRKGLGSILFRRLIATAKRKGYDSLCVTTGSQNEAMRALANKFGANLTFRHGETSGQIDLRAQPAAAIAATPVLDPAADWLAGAASLGPRMAESWGKAALRFNRDYWHLVMGLYGQTPAAPRVGR
ncbi:MAG: GNAT family N-acetyltransferase [Xanthobacteraceae bacterium]